LISQRTKNDYIKGERGSTMRRLLLLTLILFSVFSCNDEQSRQFSTTTAEIRAEDLSEYVFFLASDQLEGREAGSSGISAAEQYIAGRFESAGLQPVPGQDDFFLEFTAYRKGYNPEQTFLILDSHSDTEKYQMNNGPLTPLVPFYFSGEGTADLEFVFAGYGITAPEYEYDDYEQLDVQGKGVFLLRHEPQSGEYTGLFEGGEYTNHALFTSKAENAAKHGAAAMILVDDPGYEKEVPYLIPPRSLALDPEKKRSNLPMPDNLALEFVAVHISDMLGEQIAEQMGTSLKTLETKLNNGITPAEIGLRSVNGRISVGRYEETEEIVLRNVAARLAAEKPDAEWLVFGAHHDHLGSFSGSGDTIFNGADDNASGVAAVMELAEFFGKSAAMNTLNLLFITFSAEEAGLLGAQAVFEQDLLPETEYKTMFNIDMIGRNPGRDVDVYTRGIAEDLRRFIEETAPFDLRFLAGNAVRNIMSDHYPFQEQGIPVISFFTGIHPDYHGTGDHAEKLDYERMEMITTLISQITKNIVESASQ
jgi:hypothetical protein